MPEYDEVERRLQNVIIRVDESVSFVRLYISLEKGRDHHLSGRQFFVGK